MGSKTRLSSYCTKRGSNTVNLVTSRKINARLARPIEGKVMATNPVKQSYKVINQVINKRAPSNYDLSYQYLCKKPSFIFLVTLNE